MKFMMSNSGSVFLELSANYTSVWLGLTIDVYHWSIIGLSKHSKYFQVQGSHPTSMQCPSRRAGLDSDAACGSKSQPRDPVPCVTRHDSPWPRPNSARIFALSPGVTGERSTAQMRTPAPKPLKSAWSNSRRSNMFQYVRLPSRSSQSPGHQKLTPELPLRAPSAITRSSRNARLFSSSLVFFFNFAQGSTSWQALECQQEAKQDTKKKVCMTKPYNAKASACLVHSNVGNRRDFERCGDGLRDTFGNREASIGDADCRHDHGISQGLFVGIWLNIIMYTVYS